MTMIKNTFYPGPAMDYHEREAAKSAASQIVRSGADIETRALNALKWIESHYWRAIESENSQGIDHRRRVLSSGRIGDCTLEFEPYAGHWLWANGERLIPADLLAFLADQWGYKPEQHPMLAKGFTTYKESHAINQGFVFGGGRFTRPATRRPARA